VAGADAVSYKDHEPLLSDQRLDQIENKLRDEFPALVGALTSYIQPRFMRRLHDGVLVPVAELAVFGCLSPDPRRAEQGLLQTAALPLEDWRKLDRGYMRLIGREDPALVFFRRLVRKVLFGQDTLANIRPDDEVAEQVYQYDQERALV
jgi:hypothetical protein